MLRFPRKAVTWNVSSETGDGIRTPSHLGHHLEVLEVGEENASWLNPLGQAKKKKKKKKMGYSSRDLD